MTSWNRRMAAVDRLFAHQTTTVEHEAGEGGSDPAGLEGLGTEAPAAVSLPPAPGTAARLAALLREDLRLAHEGSAVLAGTA